MSAYHAAIRRARSLLAEARKSRLHEPTAMTLATAAPNGQPSARTVLLKEISDDGFVFYTNQTSRKSRQLKTNPRAALCFFWEPLDRQLHVEGRVVRVSNAEADAYWQTRPRESQLGAWASHQSQPLNRRSTLEKRLRALRRQHKGRPVPRPPHWSGYRVIPNRIEFWKRGAFRLHHRLVYLKKGGRWKTTLLYP
jgi:pyridoxamine 5'-phosphate oxidase